MLRVIVHTIDSGRMRQYAPCSCYCQELQLPVIVLGITFMFLRSCDAASKRRRTTPSKGKNFILIIVFTFLGVEIDGGVKYQDRYS